MKGLKRFVSVFAIAAMTVSLVGCGGGNSESSDEKVFRFGQSNPKVGLDMQTNSNSGASSVADNVVENTLHFRYTQPQISRSFHFIFIMKSHALLSAIIDPGGNIPLHIFPNLHQFKVEGIFAGV